MTSSSAGSQRDSGAFLQGYLEKLKEERVPGAGDAALKGEVRNDIVGKVDRCGNPSSSSGCLQRHAKDTLRLQLLRFDTRVHRHALALS